MDGDGVVVTAFERGSADAVIASPEERAAEATCVHPSLVLPDLCHSAASEIFNKLFNILRGWCWAISSELGSGARVEEVIRRYGRVTRLPPGRTKKAKANECLISLPGVTVT